ncbi:MAG: YicC/YloC family endoribonuclease, partial [Rhodospirillales bacterium]|nr:YicC/YloC family endoribonuclease [Rhodospirillales bacterium]
MLVAVPRRRYKGRTDSDTQEVNVPISSMTGFARSQGSENEGSWAWEIKSVNGRGLDIRCRVPPGLESLDVAVRERVAKRLRRGNLQIGLTVKRERPQGGYRVNR